MAPHSSTLAWKIPGMEKPGRLQSMGSLRVGPWLNDFTLTFHFYALEKEMETHSSVLAWRISGTGEPGGLPSMGSHRVRHDWNDLAAPEYFPRNGVAGSHGNAIEDCKTTLISTVTALFYRLNSNIWWRIDVFELWCWRRLLRVPWTARRSN